MPFLSHSAHAVYGTIVATAVLAGTDAAIEDWDSGEFLATVITTLVVLWLAQIYAYALGDISGGRLRERIGDAASEHWPVLEPIIPLGLPLMLGTLGVLTEATAVLATLSVAVVALAVWGGLAARQRGGSLHWAIGAGVLSALVGVVIIVLKTWH